MFQGYLTSLLGHTVITWVNYVCLFYINKYKNKIFIYQKVKQQVTLFTVTIHIYNYRKTRKSLFMS